MKILSLLGILLAMPAFASPGFKNGNNLQIVQLTGTVNVQCQSNAKGVTTQSYICNEDVASPAGVDVFAAGNVNATQVVLVATHQDGSKVTNTATYDSTTGQSGQIDLLTDSVFDPPLLAVGTNTVAYTLNNGSTMVSQGTFTSVVTNTGTKQCSVGAITGSCTDYATDCGQYFQQFGPSCLTSK